MFGRKTENSGSLFTRILIPFVIAVLCICLCCCDNTRGGEDGGEKGKTENTGGNNNGDVKDKSGEDDKSLIKSVSKFRKYELDEDGKNIVVFLRYREGSDHVAEITGYIKGDTNSELSEFEEVAERAKNDNVPNAEIVCSKNSSGYSCNFSFTRLDEGNGDTVGIASALLNLPENDGHFDLEDSGEYILSISGFKLSDSND